MKELYDQIAAETATRMTKKYSTSFSLAVRLLDSSIRQDIYNVYGFVRLADEIVDSFHEYPQEELLNRFEEDLWIGLERGISVNPILHAFQQTVKKYNIDKQLITAFLQSMRADLTKKTYTNQEEMNAYVYGSADVVGLMCLKVFVKGDDKNYEKLQHAALKLGSAFQKVNFLRDLNHDYANLGRVYFPNVDPDNFTENTKQTIIQEIKDDFRVAKEGIDNLPLEARFGVYLAYRYYHKLLNKIAKTPANELIQRRVRVSNTRKVRLLFRSYFKYKLNLA